MVIPLNVHLKLSAVAQIEHLAIVQKFLRSLASIIHIARADNCCGLLCGPFLEDVGISIDGFPVFRWPHGELVR